MIKNNQIILSQSITKDLGLFIINDQLEDYPYCPKYVYHKHIANDIEESQSQVMLEGSYAETILLGSCARGKSVDVLPTKKNGEKTTAQERIDIQVQRMYGYMYARGIRIKKENSQVPLIAKYGEGVWLRGELDLFPVVVDGQPSIVDYKTTKDVNNTFFTYKEDRVRFTSNSCWGDFNTIVKNQPLFYHFIARNFRKLNREILYKYNPKSKDKYDYLYNQPEEDYNFLFFVSGIGKPDIDDQLSSYEYKWNRMRANLLEILVQNSIERIRESMNNNFTPNKKDHLCKSCPLKEQCY